LLAEFYEAGKIVSAVCHGPVGFLEAKLSDGRWLVEDKELTVFSWTEEKADNRDDVVPCNLEEELKVRGARYSKAAIPLGKHVVQDGLLITGQNPASARGVGEAVARALRQPVAASVRARCSRRTMHCSAWKTNSNAALTGG